MKIHFTKKGEIYAYLVKSVTWPFEYDIPFKIIILIFKPHRAADLIVLLDIYI